MTALPSKLLCRSRTVTAIPRAGGLRGRARRRGGGRLPGIGAEVGKRLAADGVEQHQALL